MQKSELKKRLNELRKHIQRSGERVLKLDHDFLYAHPKDNDPNSDIFDSGEVFANLKLAYRHLEDARMRLGKAIQARDGGVSCYDVPEQEAIKT